MFRDLSRLKHLLVYLQFHYFDDCCLFFKRLLVVGVVLPWVSIASLLLSSVPSIRFINVFLSCFCLDYIRFGNILDTAYNFLVCYVSDTYVFWYTYGQPVSFKPLFVLWKFLYEFKLPCLTLFSSLFLQEYCNFFIEITLY